jgi:hypothetical protein
VDLTFIEENPDVVGSGLINFAKMRMISDQLLPLARLKTTPYNFTPIPEIQALLKNVKIVNDEVLYKQSKLNEPGASGKEGKKKKRTFSDEDVVRETIEEWKGINFRQQDRGVLRKDISLKSLTLKRDLSPLETRSMRG